MPFRLCSIGVAVRSLFVKGGSIVYKADSCVGQIQLSYLGCPKSKCTDFLFKCLLDFPEITSYLLFPTFFPLIIAVQEVIFCKCV
jgi:hypothetical protein